MTATFHDLENAHVFITGGGSGIGAALTEAFLRQKARVCFVGRSDYTSFAQKSAAFCIGQFQRGSQVLKVFKRVLFSHSFNFLLAPLIEAIKDIDKQIAEKIQNLVIVLLDNHFQVKSSKLTQVPINIQHS